MLDPCDTLISFTVMKKIDQDEKMNCSQKLAWHRYPECAVRGRNIKNVTYERQQNQNKRQNAPNIPEIIEILHK